MRAVELDLVAEVDDRAVDARADEALAAQALELELELALAGARDGREHARARVPSGEREDAVDDLLHRLRLDALAAARAVGDADAREEQAQVVGDLGDGADGGARATSTSGRCSMAMAGRRPSMRSTSGLASCSRNCRA